MIMASYDSLMDRMKKEEMTRAVADVRKAVGAAFAAANERVKKSEQKALEPFSAFRQELEQKQAEIVRQVKAKGGDPSPVIASFAAQFKVLDTSKHTVERTFAAMRARLMAKRDETLSRFMLNTGSEPGIS
jgi:hypothetical protein